MDNQMINYYDRLPVDEHGRKYIVRTDCCLSRAIKMGINIPDSVFNSEKMICSNCECEVLEKNLHVFTEITKDFSIIND
jgi:hypothetical protein